MLPLEEKLGREKEREAGKESRELIPGCIEPLLLLWFTDKLRGLNIAVNAVGNAVEKERERERENGITDNEWKKIALHRIYSAANGAF